MAVERVEEGSGGGNDFALSTSRRLNRVMELFEKRVEICLMSEDDIKALPES
jgi:hypothetical protein